MNVKAEKFDVLVADIEKSGNKWFTKDVIEGDEYNTVVYHGRLEIHGNSLPVTLYSPIFVWQLQQRALQMQPLKKYCLN